MNPKARLEREGCLATVLVPVRDEAETVAEVVARTLALGKNLRVVVVDDGSLDNTAAAAAAAGAEVLRLGASRGKGAALRAGLEVATGEFVVTIDGDGQDDPADIPALLERANEGYDLVIGSRFLKELHPAAISRLNRLGTAFFTLLINVLYRTRLTDSQAGLRVFRRSFLDGISFDSSEYEIETEMLVKALRRGARVSEVAVTRLPRRTGVSRFRRTKHGLRILFTILSNRMR